MKMTRFTEPRIVKAVKGYENGRNVIELSRDLGTSTVAFYKWRQHIVGWR